MTNDNDKLRRMVAFLGSEEMRNNSANEDYRHGFNCGRREGDAAVSRSGYHDDLDQSDLAMWRGQVASSIRGKRGQALLRDIATYMDAMPTKELVRGAIETPEGAVCALGCALRHRGLTQDDDLHRRFDAESTASRLDIAACLAKEVTFINDEAAYNETPAQRWKRVRAWVAEQLTKKETPQ